jgi:hypothetical protein
MYLVFRCIDFFYLMGYLLSINFHSHTLKFSPMFSDVHRQLHITLKCTGKVVGKRDQTDRSPKPERAENWDPNKYNYRQTTVFVLGKYFLLNHVRYGNFCYVLTPTCFLQCGHIVYPHQCFQMYIDNYILP